VTLEQASIFLSGSILFALGMTALILALVAINNLIHRFWKPVTILTKESFSLFAGHQSNDPMQNLTQEEYDRLVEHLEKMRASKSSIDKQSI
jgi:hypothetical protein